MTDSFRVGEMRSGAENPRVSSRIVRSTNPKRRCEVKNQVQNAIPFVLPGGGSEELPPAA